MKKRFLKLGILVSVFALTINPISIYARSANGNPNTYEELTKDIVREMQQRKTNFVINYEGDSSPIINKEYDIFSDIKKIDDYNSWSYERINTRIQKSSSITTFTFTVDYFATLEQEQYVSNELDKVLSEIITDDMTDREKLDAISTWILELLVYDHTLTYRSTYDALIRKEVVCQGYAMLLDLMCEKVGIRSELVLGGLNGAPDGHGWNVVRLDGKWYYIDLTNVDKPINRPYYLVTKAQLQGHNFVWDDSLINFTEHRTVFPVEDNISLRYDNVNNKLIIENTGDSQVDIFYNTDIFSDWNKFSNSNGWKNSLYDGFGKTSDGRHFGYYSNNAWNLNNSLHANANSEGVIEPIGFQDGKYTILMRVKDDSSTIYKAIDFTVNGSTSKGSTGMKDSTYYNDLFKTEVESKVVNGKILVDTKNPALVVKSYRINNEEEVVVQDKKSTYSIDPNTDGTVSLLLTVENIYNDGYGDYRTKNYTYTLDIPQVSTTPTPTVEPTAPPVTPTPTVEPTAPPVTPTPTVEPTAPPVTQTPTVVPTAPPVTTTPTVEPTNPPVTTTPTVAPTNPPVTTTPTVVPTAPPVTQTPTVVPTAPPVTPKPTVVPTAPPVTVIPTPTPYYPILTESEIVSLADDRRQVSLYVEVLNLLNKAQHESEMDNTEDVFIIIKEAKGLMNQIKYTEMLNILKTEYLKVQMHLEEEMANEVISETLDNLSKKSLSEFLSFIETVENEDLRKSLYSEHERFTETFEKLQLSEVKGLIKKANKNPTLKVLNQIKSIISEIDDKDTQKQLNKQYVELDKKLDKKEISAAKKQLTITKKKITKANLDKLNKAIKLVDSKKDKTSLQKEYNKLLVKFNKKA